MTHHTDIHSPLSPAMRLMRPKAMRLALLCIFLCLALGTRAELGRHMRQIDHSNGLSNSTVLSIFQDRQGIMWLGTYDGLNAYDGRDVRVYRADKKQARPLLSNVIYDVAQGPADHIWVSTNMGVNLFDTHSGKVVAAFQQFKNTYTILSNTDGQTWGIGPNTVSYYCPKAKRFVDTKIACDKLATQLWFTDSQGALWLTFRNGQTVRCTLRDMNDPKATLHTESVTISTRPMRYAFAHNNILTYIDADGNLFVYNLLTRMKWYVRNVAELMARYGRISNMLQAKDYIFISFLQGQQFSLDAQRHYAETLVSSDARTFSSYYDDAQDILWVGTDCQGLRMYASQDSPVSQLLFSDVENRVNRPARTFITDADGSLWMGTKGDGLLRLPLAGDTYSLKNATVYYPLSKTPLALYTRDRREFPIFKLSRSRYHNGFWIGADMHPALAFYDRGADQVIPLNGTDTLQYVHSVCEQDAHTLWVCTGGTGLYRIRLDASGRRVTEARPFMLKVNGDPITEYADMLMEGDSVLWLASRGYGLIRYSIRRHSFARFSTNSGINSPSDDVLGILRKGDVFWLGTNSGLVKITLLKGLVYKMQHIGQADGMLSDMVHGVLEDSQGVLWLSTDKGLVAYNPRRHILHNYYMKNGIKVGEFCDDAFYKDPASGRLFFGGINGMVYFTQRQQQPHARRPNIYYQDMVVNGESEPFYEHYDIDTRTLRLSGLHLNFTLRFAVLDYANNENYEYAYRLKGSQDEWTAYSEQNAVTLKGIAPGTYTLCIKAKTGVDDQNQCYYELPLVVSPPWYLAWWMVVVYVALLALLATYGVRLGLNYYHQSKLVRTLQLYESSHNQHNMADSYMHRIAGKAARLIADAARLHAQQPDPARDKTLTDICDTLLSLGVNAADNNDSLQSLMAVMPTHYRIHSKTNLLNIVADLSGALMHENGLNISNLDIHIDDQLAVALPENTLRYVLHHMMYLCATSSAESALEASIDDEGHLLLTLKASAHVCGSLLQKKPQGDAPTQTPLSEHTMSFALYLFGIEAMGATLTRTPQGLTMRMPQMPIQQAGATADDTRPTLLLLERDQNMNALIHDLLDNTYRVVDAQSIKEAMAAFNTHRIDIFLADTLPYRNMETQFMQFVKSMHGTLMDTTFVAIFSWQGFSRLDQMLKGILDSYVIAPFGVFFLAENIRMAIMRKAAPRAIGADGAATTANGEPSLAAQGLPHDATDTPLTDTLTAEQAQFMARFMAIVDKHLSDEDLSTNLIADEMNMSARQFYRRFKECSLLSPAIFIKNHRVEKAAQLLRNTDKSIQEILFEVGFKSKAYFYKEFSVRYGRTPKEYREEQS